ncbi:helix-turn-helix domain-containing protein [Dyella humicola]|uniref:helix-turn-helix domain-containing protein n=1 Tax=Dyella humicola TaxID=2992126 RepID=UPI00224F99EC
MSSNALVQLALTATGYSQKELSLKLGVSPTQVSKWKKGDYISFEMEGRLRELAQIGDLDPDVVVSAGSLEAAKKWQRLIAFLANFALEGAETGYTTVPLQDELDLLIGATVSILKEIGAPIPPAYPRDIDLNFDDAWEDEATDCALLDAIEANPYSRTILAIFRALNDVYGFYAAYLCELFDREELGLMETPAENIEPGLIELAATKVDVDKDFAPHFGRFRAKIRADYEKWICLVKDKAFQAGVPLRAELLNLVYDSSDALSHKAEAESLGFNAGRIHPDIYMNELLVGMRVIHQVLPAILKKLGIDEEFKLDPSELSLGDFPRPEDD